MANVHTHQKAGDGELHWVWVIIVIALIGVLGRFLLGGVGATRIDSGAVGEPTPAAEAGARLPADAPRTP
jgi:hypothetical protein